MDLANGQNPVSNRHMLPSLISALYGHPPPHIPNATHFKHGIISGKISDTIQGTNGFGYDQIFIPDGHDKTYAEMTAEEKNEISMRKIALLKFKDFFLK